MLAPHKIVAHMFRYVCFANAACTYSHIRCGWACSCFTSAFICVCFSFATPTHAHSTTLATWARVSVCVSATPSSWISNGPILCWLMFTFRFVFACMNARTLSCRYQSVGVYREINCFRSYCGLSHSLTFVWCACLCLVSSSQLSSFDVSKTVWFSPFTHTLNHIHQGPSTMSHTYTPIESERKRVKWEMESECENYHTSCWVICMYKVYVCISVCETAVGACVCIWWARF